MDNIYENIDECNSSKKRKILIVFDDYLMINCILIAISAIKITSANSY